MIKNYLTTIVGTMFIVFVNYSLILSATSLNVEEVRHLALNNNTYLEAKQELIKADAQVITARAGGLPHLDLNTYYTRNIKLPTFFLNPGGGEAVSFQVGFKNDFGASLSLKQSLWKGGKVFNAYKVSKLYKKYSKEMVDQVEANVIAQAEKLFHAALLSHSNLEVLQKADEAKQANLDVVQKHYDKGMASKFDLLQAKVEKANLQPQIIAAESDIKLSEKSLKSFLNIDLSEEIFLIDEEIDTAMVSRLYLDTLVSQALENRPEVNQAELQTDMRRRAVSIMRSDYFPQIEAVSSYNWQAQSDQFSMSENNVRSWSAGITLSIPIFKGGETRGNVKNTKAEYHQAVIQERDLKSNIRLEVEQAYDKLIQAKKAIEVQTETIAQAEEGLKIADLRFESGVGTQLEVISAQAALTKARNSFALAKFNFQNATTELKRVTATNIN